MLLALVYRVVCVVLRLILTRGRPVSAAEIELLVLRHERRVLRRRVGGAAWRPEDRLWLTALSRCLPSSVARLPRAPDHATAMASGAGAPAMGRPWPAAPAREAPAPRGGAGADPAPGARELQLGLHAHQG